MITFIVDVVALTHVEVCDPCSGTGTVVGRPGLLCRRCNGAGVRTLLDRARDVLAKSSAMGEASAMAINPSGGKGSEPRIGPPGFLPSGERSNWSLYESIAYALSTARDEFEFRHAVQRAESQIRKALVSPPPRSETSEERTDRWLADHEGIEDRVAADAEGVGIKVMWKVRKDNGRDPKMGRVIEIANLVWATPAERRRRARELRDLHDLSARQIALRLGVSHPTILDDLRDSPARRTA